MSEPEVAIAFTADMWVEELHRHLSDHGGARVRTLLVESEGALDESYDVLLAGHRWPALTIALVADLHARGRMIVGVYDREEAASRDHLISLGVDALVETDAGPEAFVRTIVRVAGRRNERSHESASPAPRRPGRVVAVGGPPGTGRTEIAIELAVAIARRNRAVLLDADDVAPAVAARLHLPIEPNLRTAIDAVEHGRGSLQGCVLAEPASQLRVVTGLPNTAAWAQVRPGEVGRVIDRLACEHDYVVIDGVGMLEDVAVTSVRGRFATARAVVADADAVIGICDPSPHGLARLFAWVIEARALAPAAPFLLVANRAPAARFRRGELYEEIRRTVPVVDVMFVPSDPRVGDAAWSGRPTSRGQFTRAVTNVGERILGLLGPATPVEHLEAAS